VSSAWIWDSLAAGRWLEEEHYGGQFLGSPFRGRTVQFHPSFIEENKPNDQKLKNAKMVLQSIGKATVVTHPTPANIVILGVNTPTPYDASGAVQYFTWVSLAEYILSLLPQLKPKPDAKVKPAAATTRADSPQSSGSSTKKRPNPNTANEEETFAADNGHLYKKRKISANDDS